MKKKQAQKLLDQTVLEFGDVLADILFEAKLMVHTYKSVRTGEAISFNKATGRYIRTGIGEWFNAVLASDLASPKPAHFSLGGRFGDRNSILKRFPMTMNAEFRWLLVAGYEAYERFLGQLYAVLGYCDRNLWRCADFGNERVVNQIAGMSLADFRDCVKEPFGLQPRKIKSLLAHRFGRIQSIGSRNSISFGTEVITYSEYIDLIELMRHVTVHEQAKIDPDDFFGRLQRKWNRKKPITKELRALILSNVFKQLDGSWQIWLVAESSSSVHDVHARPLGALMERLGSYACLQYGQAIQHFGNKPFWK